MSAEKNDPVVLNASNRLLTVMATAVSAEHDKFTGWMVAGLGAALAWLLANDKASLVESASLKWGVRIYLVMIVCHAVQRIAGSVVSSSAAVADKTLALMKDESITALEPEQMPGLMTRIENASLWPFSTFIRRGNAKLRAGDIEYPGRLLLKVAQTQTYLMLLQAALGVGIVAVLTAGLI